MFKTTELSLSDDLVCASYLSRYIIDKSLALALYFRGDLQLNHGV